MNTFQHPHNPNKEYSNQIYKYKNKYNNFFSSMIILIIFIIFFIILIWYCGNTPQINKNYEQLNTQLFIIINNISFKNIIIFYLL